MSPALCMCASGIVLPCTIVHCMHVCNAFTVMALLCRVPAATLALLVDTSDPECLEVRHCMNNSCDQHAVARGSMHATQHDGSSNAKCDAEPEEDLMKLPFFLIPRSIGPHVAKRLLRHGQNAAAVTTTRTPKYAAASGCAAAPAQSMQVELGGKSLSKNSRPEFTPQHAALRNGASMQLFRSQGGQYRHFEGDMQRGLWERGCAWEVQEVHLSRDVEEPGEAYDAEEAKELVAEVECTLVDLGLWTPASE